MMPQTACFRTNTPRHKVKQGVGQVKVIQNFIMPDGTIKSEHELTEGERQGFCQKVLDAFTPLLYDLVMEDIRREQEAEA